LTGLFRVYIGSQKCLIIIPWQEYFLYENGGYQKIKKFDTDRDYILGWERVSQPKGKKTTKSQRRHFQIEK